MVVLVTNRTRKQKMGKVEVYKSIFSQSIGLMCSKPRQLLFIFKKEKKVPLHMWFVFFSIDVIFLDKKKKVVEIKQNFKPWSYYSPKKKAQYILELKKGTVKKTKTKVGDQISF